MAYEPQTPYAIRQFEIDVLIPLHLFGVDASFTISSQAMITTVIAVSAYCYFAMRESATIPRRLQGSAEAVYEFIEGTLIRYGGPDAKRALPLVVTLFVFILFGTLIGLTPVKFTFTSHLVVTLALSTVVFIYVTALALKIHGLGFLRFFIPAGTPTLLIPLIFVIELISYLFRPITLGVRIFANILAGHIMLKLFGDLSAMLVDAFGTIGMLVALLPAAMIVVMYFVEVFVCGIQAYIFVVLTALYIRQAIEGH